MNQFFRIFYCLLGILSICFTSDLSAEAESKTCTIINDTSKRVTIYVYVVGEEKKKSFSYPVVLGQRESKEIRVKDGHYLLGLSTKSICRKHAIEIEYALEIKESGTTSITDIKTKGERVTRKLTPAFEPPAKWLTSRFI